MPEHALAIPRTAAVELGVEPAEEALLAVVVALLQRREERRAQRGRQHEGDQHGQRHRRDDRHRELPVDDAGGAGEERHRHEDRGEHEADAHERAGDLVHRLARRLERRQSFLAHQAFDVLDHDDGVVDEQADRQHHREHRQHVDRVAERGEHAERAQQYDRHGDRRDQRRAQVLQEQEHDEEDEQDRLGQRLDHFDDRGADERRRVERHDGLQARREDRAPSASSAASTAFGRLQRVGARRERDGHAGRRLAVVAAQEFVGFGAELDARDVAELEHRSVGIAAHDDVAELLGVCRRSCALTVALSCCPSTEGVPPSCPTVTCAFCACTAATMSLVVSDRCAACSGPARCAWHTAHRTPGCCRRPSTRLSGSTMLADDVVRDVVAIHAAVCRTRTPTTCRKPDCATCVTLTPWRCTACGSSGMASCSLFCTCTCAMSGSIALSKVSVTLARPLAWLVGRHVDQAVEALHVLLDDLRHRVLDHLGRGARVAGADVDRRRRDVRIHRDRQLRDRQRAEQHDDDRDDPREDGPVDEEACHGVSRLTALLWRRQALRPRAEPHRPRSPAPGRPDGFSAGLRR